MCLLLHLKTYLFVAALAPRCFRRAFSSGRDQELLSSCGAQASRCGGFSCCGAPALGARASAVVAHGLSCSEACGDLPGSGIKPMCPALAGGFLTSGPPGKFSLTFFIFFKPVITVGNLNSFLLENCTISFSTISSQGQGNWGICLPTHFLQLIEGCRGVF